MRNVDAKCANGKCSLACQTDIECGNPKAYHFYSCVKNECVYVGCEKDKDCELFTTGGSDAGGVTIGHYVCK